MKFDKLACLETIEVSGHSERFNLQKEGIWFVEKGSVDIFAIEKEEREQRGVHHFLIECTEDSFIFSFPQDVRYDIQAVAEPNTFIKFFSPALFFEDLAKEETLLKAFIPLFNRWFEKLSSNFSKFTKVAEHTRLFFLTQKKPLHLKKGEKILFERLIGEEGERQVHWVKGEKGSFNLLGWPNVRIEAPFYLPLKSDLWWEANEDSSLISFSPLNLIKEKKWQLALAQFNDWFLNALESASKEESVKEKKLIETRQRLEEKSLKKSFTLLSSVLQENVRQAPEKTDDLLFLACSYIGKKMGIYFKEPRSQHFHNPAIHLAEICEISGIRYRQVRLDGSWWEEDSGHMLGFYGQNKTPVALIWENKGYILVDPTNEKEERLNAKTARLIYHAAYSFYSPFAGSSYNIGNILKFGYANMRGKMISIFVIGVLVSLLDLVLPFGSKIIFGSAIPQLNETLMWQIGLGIIIASIASALYQLAQGLLIFHVNSIAGNQIECAQMDRMLKLPVSFYKKFSVGDLWSRIYGFVTVRRAFNNYYITLLFNGIFSFFYLIAMGIFSIHLTIAAILISASFVAFASTCMYLMMKFQQQSLEIKGKINGLIVQALNGISKIRNAGVEKKIFSKWGAEYAEQKKNDLKSQLFNTAITTAFAILPSFSFFAIFTLMIYFVYMTENNPESLAVTKGDFFGFVTAFGAFSGAVIGAVPAVTNFYRRVKPLWNRARTIFQAQPEADPSRAEVKNLEGHIVVDQVCFRYEEKGPLILKNISIKAYPGEFIGIVGPSGSGKSTLIRLLLGFEKPETGSIYFDGADLAHLDLHSVRRQIGTVLQHGSLLAGTIYENLVWGGIYSNEQLERAIHLSGFYRDLPGFSMGLHTVLPSGGGTMSGGQRQRLMIARALISDPKILLFDEATSALDNRTQDEIRQNVEQLKVTRVVIAHRLSTIRHADRIYVLDKGEVIDQGTFEELAQRGGKFSEIVARQKL